MEYLVRGFLRGGLGRVLFCLGVWIFFGILKLEVGGKRFCDNSRCHPSDLPLAATAVFLLV